MKDKFENLLLLVVLTVGGAVGIVAGIIVAEVVVVGVAIAALGVISVAIITLLIVVIGGEVIINILSREGEKGSLSFLERQSIISLRSNKYFRLKSWIPKEQKEEIIGDLAEQKAAMIKEGYYKWFARLTIVFHYTHIAIGFKWNKIREGFKTQKQIDKDI